MTSPPDGAPLVGPARPSEPPPAEDPAPAPAPAEPSPAEPSPAPPSPAHAQPATPVRADATSAELVALRAPAHPVSPRAVGYWRLSAALGALLEWVLLAAAYVVLPRLAGARPGWAAPALVLLVLASLAPVVVMPTIRYRVHRWEVSDTAVHTRSGWLTRQERIAPLSRVQTVDSKQGALMRLFGLGSITVTTASAAGPISIDCLDQEVARRTVAELTEITGRTTGDAT